MRIRDWSSDVCASDLRTLVAFLFGTVGGVVGAWRGARLLDLGPFGAEYAAVFGATYVGGSINFAAVAEAVGFRDPTALAVGVAIDNVIGLTYLVLAGAAVSWTAFTRRFAWRADGLVDPVAERSEEHTSELQSLMRISYAVFCLKQKK